VYELARQGEAGLRAKLDRLQRLWLR
jgi:hypothetical protein